MTTALADSASERGAPRLRQEPPFSREPLGNCGSGHGRDRVWCRGGCALLRAIAWTCFSSFRPARGGSRSEEHTSELQSLMRISYAVFCLKKKNKPHYATKTYDAIEP